MTWVVRCIEGWFSSVLGTIQLWTVFYVCMYLCTYVCMRVRMRSVSVYAMYLYV